MLNKVDLLMIDSRIINPVSYILLPFHQALPHPGFAYSFFKHDYYRRSFKHLYDLVVYDGGSLAAKLIELLAASLSMGGKIREDFLQQGAIHYILQHCFAVFFFEHLE